jgi:hypothetical protein
VSTKRVSAQLNHAVDSWKRHRPAALHISSSDALNYTATCVLGGAAEASVMRTDTPPSSEQHRRDTQANDNPISEIVSETLMHPTPETSQDVARIREKLVRWFTIEAPAQVERLDDLLLEYEGREDLLLLRVVGGERALITDPEPLDRSVASEDVATLQDDDDVDDDRLEMEVAILERACDRLSYQLSWSSSGRSYVPLLSGPGASLWETSRQRALSLGALVTRICAKQVKSAYMQEEMRLFELNTELRLRGEAGRYEKPAGSRAVREFS